MMMPYNTELPTPYTITGPAMENICAAVPSTMPSCLNSSAGETTELAKPVIGTIVPAPAWRAILSNTPIPVRMAVIIITTQGVAILISFSLSPALDKIVFSSWPNVHIRPPIINALTQFRIIGESGLAL